MADTRNPVMLQKKMALFALVVLVLGAVLGAACSNGSDTEVRAGGNTDNKLSSPSTTSGTAEADPAASEPGDAEVCRVWQEEGNKTKAEGGYKTDDKAPQPDPNQTRPYAPGVKGSRVDPAEYLPVAERDRLKDRSSVLLPTWLPEEVLKVSPELFVPQGSNTGHTVHWPRAADGSSPMIDVHIYGLTPSNAAKRKDNPPPSNVKVRGKDGLIQHMTDGEFISWLWAPDIEVNIVVDALDYRVNCQELLAIARSVKPFDPRRL
jgi:hypothetical protein